MKTDFLKGLGLNEEQISSIMAENGKDIEREKSKAESVKTELEQAKAAAADVQKKLEELSSSAGDAEKVKAELDALKADNARREAESKAKEDDDALTASVLAAIGDKQFVNDFTKKALIQEIKDEHLKDTTKGVEKVFEALTKDKEGIFANPNEFKPNMGGFGDVVKPAFTPEQLKAMTPEQINQNWEAVKSSLQANK